MGKQVPLPCFAGEEGDERSEDTTWIPGVLEEDLTQVSYTWRGESATRIRSVSEAWSDASREVGRTLDAARALVRAGDGAEPDYNTLEDIATALLVLAAEATRQAARAQALAEVMYAQAQRV